MEISITNVLLILTIIVSLVAFNDRNLKYSLTFSPYSVKHHSRWWLVITHAFIHVDYSHLIMNMIGLYFFGPIVEDGLRAHSGELLGMLHFTGLYIGGIVFSTLPAIKKHGDNAGYLAVGASGAISAVVFAAIVLNPLMEMGVIFIPGLRMRAFIFGIIYVLFEYYASKKGQSHIAHDAHIGGAIFGILYLAAVDYSIFQQFIYYVSMYVNYLIG